MSPVRRIHRRSLFDVFRQSPAAPAVSTPDRTAAASPAAFSLTSFYERRGQEEPGAQELPRFALREGLPAVETVPPFAEPFGPKRTS